MRQTHKEEAANYFSTRMGLSASTGTIPQDKVICQEFVDGLKSHAAFIQ